MNRIIRELKAVGAGGFRRFGGFGPHEAWVGGEDHGEGLGLVGQYGDAAHHDLLVAFGTDAKVAAAHSRKGPHPRHALGIGGPAMGGTTQFGFGDRAACGIDDVDFDAGAAFDGHDEGAVAKGCYVDVIPSAHDIFAPDHDGRARLIIGNGEGELTAVIAAGNEGSLSIGKNTHIFDRNGAVFIDNQAMDFYRGKSRGEENKQQNKVTHARMIKIAAL